MPPKVLKKPIHIHITLNTEHMAQSLEKAKRKTGIEQSVTLCKYLIVQAASDGQ